MCKCGNHEDPTVNTPVLARVAKVKAAVDVADLPTTAEVAEVIENDKQEL